MTRFPTYPPDILSRADALLSEKYPDGIVDPRFVEIACEAMIVQREVDATIADDCPIAATLLPLCDEAGNRAAETGQNEAAERIAKAIRGTK